VNVRQRGKKRSFLFSRPKKANYGEKTFEKTSSWRQGKEAPAIAKPVPGGKKGGGCPPGKPISEAGKKKGQPRSRGRGRAGRVRSEEKKGGGRSEKNKAKKEKGEKGKDVEPFLGVGTSSETQKKYPGVCGGAALTKKTSEARLAKKKTEETVDLEIKKEKGGLYLPPRKKRP